MKVERCPGCGGQFPPGDGMTHAYMASSPGCWAAYGRVLEREYADPALFARCHRLTVDAYALQHPGDRAERRAVRSVWLHFLSLHAIFSRRADQPMATALLQSLAKRALPPRPDAPAFALTLADLAFADHAGDAERWARDAYERWLPLLGGDADRLLG